MSRGAPRSTKIAAVLLAVVMAVSISGVFVTAAAAGPTDPAGGVPADNSTARNVTALESADAILANQSGDASLARDQLDLVRDLRAIDEKSTTSELDKALATAEAVLTQRQQWASSESKPLPTSMESQFAVSKTKLDAARALLDSPGESQDSYGLSNAIEKAKQGTKIQAALASDSVTRSSELPSVETPNHESPSAAVLAIMNRYNVTPTAEDGSELRRLDDLPDPTRTALTNFLDAYLAFQRNTAEGDVVGTFAARNQLLDETVTVHKAFENADTPGGARMQANPDTQIGCVDESSPGNTTPTDPTFCVLTFDNTGSHNTYTTNSVLLIDDGGNDHYDMNAGGTNLDDDCKGVTNDVSTSQDHLNPDPPTIDAGVATAMVDLGTGNDNYTRTTAVGCGQRGGALVGSGFLVDQGGTDEYGNATNRSPADIGVNGGAAGSLFGAGSGAGFTGVVPTHGFLLDAGDNAGTEQFTAGNFGTNGGATNSDYVAYGFLMNVNGEATYTAGSVAVNGGAEDRGSGFLADLGTEDDTYDTEAKGTNGGAIYQAEYGGFLLDNGGGDTYTATSQGTNGGGAQQGNGFLLDEGPGDDIFKTGHPEDPEQTNNGIFVYNTGDISKQQGLSGVNGGAREHGTVGVLINIGSGSDRYKTGDGQGSNGGAFGPASGLLLDTGGNDDYISGYDPTENSTWNNSFGPTIRWPSAGANGGAVGGGVGALLDTDGNDNYTALDGHKGGVNASNGGAWALGTAGGAGLLSDGDGEDTYKANATDAPVTGANGGGSGFGVYDAAEVFNFASQNISKHRATGTLVDDDGSDHYIANAMNTTANNNSANETVAGVNGGAFNTSSTGTLVDAHGKDNYTANATRSSETATRGVNGGVQDELTPNISGNGVNESIGAGLLLDASEPVSPSNGDGDIYIDDRCGNRTDDTVVPKGIAGHQIDANLADSTILGCG